MNDSVIINRIEALSSRLARAKAIVGSELVEEIDRGIYFVSSQQGQAYYTVDSSGCDCPDSVRRFELTQGYCKHRLAVEIYMQEHSVVSQDILSPQELRDTVESLYGPQNKAA